MNSVVLNKIAIIERCLERINEEFDSDFRSNYTKQDSVILNIERACEASIDLGSHVIRLKKLGLPQSARDIFSLLAEKHVISEQLAKKLQHMVGFRNIAVHDYQRLNLDIVESVVESCLHDFGEFAKAILALNLEK